MQWSEIGTHDVPNRYRIRREHVDTRYQWLSPEGAAPVGVEPGAVHVDGGVMNNLPGDIMRRHAGIVITVDVDSRENMSCEFTEFPSPGKIFWSRVLPWKKAIPTPNVAEIMMATIMTGCRKSADAVKEDADLSLEPPVQGIGILDFKTIEKTAQMGYEYTLGIIDGLPDDSPLRRFFI